MDFWIKIQSSDWTSPYFYDPNLNTRFSVVYKKQRGRKKKKLYLYESLTQTIFSSNTEKKGKRKKGQQLYYAK